MVGQAKRRRRKLTVGDAVSNDLNREALCIADRLIPRLAITHYARQFEGLRDPAPVFLSIEFDRKIHPLIILPGVNSAPRSDYAWVSLEGPDHTKTVKAVSVRVTGR